MGCRDIDKLKEVGYKMEIVLCSVKKLRVPSFLFWGKYISIIKNGEDENKPLATRELTSLMQ